MYSIVDIAKRNTTIRNTTHSIFACTIRLILRILFFIFNLDFSSRRKSYTYFLNAIMV